MKSSLILHGHFYQPPREMPDTGIIPLQPSAFPDQDWNERICHQCYAANARSRVLSYDGRVERIRNTYEYLSFNIGPTLLHWIRDNDRETYERIIDADRASVSRLGYGNAIAQGYNHTILPLDRPEDARRQILWGLEDFEYHFGRRSESIWLPEAAVNQQVIDILIEYGLKYIILSPWQARSVQDDQGNWVDLGTDHAPSHRPYLLEGTHGQLAVFYYHPGLAQGISFGHYLQDADRLFDRLVDFKADGQEPLLHAATDGEIYGHHEPFGDMCLAALVDKVASSDQFVLTNYASFLEDNPPVLKTRLKRGEQAKGTSWSCFHGVSRWFKDCGCSTGAQEGWDQKWRTPLRRAFRALRDTTRDLVDSNLRELSRHYEPSEIQDQYIRVLSGKESPQAFCSRILGSSSTEEQRTRLLTLLEAEKFSMFSFTSCGWFFNDISGLEPIQNIRYAIQAARLYMHFSDDRDLVGLLASHLEQAQSNIEGQGNGKEILVSIHPTLSRSIEAAAYFVLNRLMACRESWTDRYGIFELKQITDEDRQEFDLVIEDTPLCSTARLHVSYLNDRTQGIILHIYHTDSLLGPSGGYPVQIADLPERVVNELYQWIDLSLSKVADNDLARITRDISNYSAIVRQGGGEPTDSFYIMNMGTCLRTLHSLMRLRRICCEPQARLLASELLELIRAKGDEKLRLTTENSLSAYIQEHARELSASWEDSNCSAILELLELFRSHGFEPKVTILQNLVYDHLIGSLGSKQKLSEPLLELARRINFDLEAILSSEPQ